MGIISKKMVNGVATYTVSKDMTDEETHKKGGLCLTPANSKNYVILREDADVYTEDGAVLLRFRKEVLPKKDMDIFYDNVIKFAKSHKTTNRGMATGTKKGKRNILEGKGVASNILGYMDTWTVQHKYMFSQVGMKEIKPSVRRSYFSQSNYDNWLPMQSLVKHIDAQYKKLAPAQYKKQRAKADETYFKIKGTAFTTLTTNVNFNTCAHQDAGDDEEGLGNLVVLQRGDYEGGETCFIQYGVGVDVREGDFLLMDVHQLHANTKLKLKTPESIRLSIVSYLRTGIWKKTRTMTQKQAKQHMGKIADFYGKIEKKKANNGTRKTGKPGKPLVFISDQFAESEHKVAKELAIA
jgi:hypothetical protein